MRSTSSMSPVRDLRCPLRYPLRHPSPKPARAVLNPNPIPCDHDVLAHGGNAQCGGCGSGGGGTSLAPACSFSMGLAQQAPDPSG